MSHHAHVQVDRMKGGAYNPSLAVMKATEKSNPASAIYKAQGKKGIFNPALIVHSQTGGAYNPALAVMRATEKTNSATAIYKAQGKKGIFNPALAVHKQTGGNAAAVLDTVKTIAGVKPFSKGEALSKKIGLYDKLEGSKYTSWLNRIADVGEAIGLGQNGGGAVIKV